MLTYKEKIIEACSKAKTLEDFDYIKEKLGKTDKINRRTEDGRKLTIELEQIIYDYEQKAIIKYKLTPF